MPAGAQPARPDIRYALFDLDRTLIDVNSGRLWLMNEWRTGRIGVRDVAWGAWWLGRYSLGFDNGLDEVFATAARTLEDTSERELEERVRVWFAAEVAPRLRPGGRRALDDHRALGHELVVATSSSVYVARCAMETFGLDDEVSTTFHSTDDRFDGRIDRLAVGRAKADAVRAWAAASGIDLAACAFYTDSLTDLALLEVVGQPVVVHPDRPLAREAVRRGWPVVDWGRSR